MPYNDHDVERQITSLAARADPHAFERRNDHLLEGRRLDALNSAADTMRHMQLLLAWGALALVGTSMAVYLILT